MARRFKRRLFEQTGLDLGRFYHELPDGKMTTDPQRAMKARESGQNVRRLPRLGEARLGH